VPELTKKPYHHGGLREAVLKAALEEIEAVGPARLSMREIARRAGVSHAAPAHHFGDKAGIFTAIAIDGYRLLRETTSVTRSGPDALLQGGVAYVVFAITHRAHFEVMFRPELFRAEDPDLETARLEAVDVLFRAVAAGLGTDDPEQVTATAIAAWSVAHGFAALWLNGNFPTEITEHPDEMAPLIIKGVGALGAIAERQSGVSPLPSFARMIRAGEAASEPEG
jgi:AcrR family transcriptional regulator